MSEISIAQKILIKEFNEKFINLMINYWNPSSSEEYWNNLTDDAVNLIQEFQTSDEQTNELFSALVMSFMNSRENFTA